MFVVSFESNLRAEQNFETPFDDIDFSDDNNLHDNDVYEDAPENFQMEISDQDDSDYSPDLEPDSTDAEDEFEIFHAREPIQRKLNIKNPGQVKAVAKSQRSCE